MEMRLNQLITLVTSRWFLFDCHWELTDTHEMLSFILKSLWYQLLYCRKLVFGVCVCVYAQYDC